MRYRQRKAREITGEQNEQSAPMDHRYRRRSTRGFGHLLVNRTVLVAAHGVGRLRDDGAGSNVWRWRHDERIRNGFLRDVAVAVALHRPDRGGRNVAGAEYGRPHAAATARGRSSLLALRQAAASRLEGLPL